MEFVMVQQLLLLIGEDTDGDGLGNPGTETEGCVDGTRDVTDGCDPPENNIYLNSDGSVVYNSSVLIGGFQFNVDGATINSASGGDAGDAGMMVSPAGGYGAWLFNERVVPLV